MNSLHAISWDDDFFSLGFGNLGLLDRDMGHRLSKWQQHISLSSVSLMPAILGRWQAWLVGYRPGMIKNQSVSTILDRRDALIYTVIARADTSPHTQATRQTFPSVNTIACIMDAESC